MAQLETNIWGLVRTRSLDDGMWKSATLVATSSFAAFHCYHMGKESVLNMMETVSKVNYIKQFVPIYKQFWLNLVSKLNEIFNRLRLIRKILEDEMNFRNLWATSKVQKNFYVIGRHLGSILRLVFESEEKYLMDIYTY